MKQDFRKVALSGWQITGFLLIIATFILAFAAIAHQERPTEGTNTLQMISGIAAGVAALLSIVCFVVHHRLASRLDIHPDILDALLGSRKPAQVFELDTLHFWAGARQMDSRIRIGVLLQNVYAKRCGVRLQFDPRGTTETIPNASVPLEIELRGAEVVFAWRDLPVPIPQTAEASFGISGWRKDSKSKRIRYKRYSPVRSETSLVQLAAVGAAGVIYHCSGNQLNLKLARLPENFPFVREPTCWQVQSLWSPEKPVGFADVSMKFSQLFNADPETNSSINVLQSAPSPPSPS